MVLSARFVREALALVLLLLAIISVIALFAPDAGAIVRPWHALLSTALGWGIAFAAPLLAGFAVMLWMKTMPAERWMAATGASARPRASAVFGRRPAAARLASSASRSRRSSRPGR